MGSHHFGRTICNLLCCIFFIGPILFLVGFGLLYGSLRNPLDHAIHIENYNDAVLTWVGDDAFGNFEYTSMLANVSMSFDVLKQTARLFNVSSSETFFNDTDEEIYRYVQFMRFEGGSAVDVSNHCSDGPPWYGCDMSSFLSFQLILNGVNITHIDVPTFKRTRVPSTKSLCPSGSYWDNSTQNCDTYSLATSICVKVAQDQSHWFVDNGWVGPGCGETTWGAVSYQHMPITHSAFPKIIYVALKVRSLLDPRVQFYLEMGPGATTFGPSQGASLAGSVALICIGALLLCCCALVCCRLSRLDKSHRTYNEVRAPMVYAQPAVVYGQPVVYAQPVQPLSYPPQQQPPYQGYPPQQQPSYQAYPSYQQTHQ